MGHEIYSNENEVEGVRIRVEYDDDAESPRTAWDNVTAFWSDGMHRRYNFHEAAADEVLARIKSAMPVPDELLEDGSDVEIIQWLMENQTPVSSYVIMPVYMYDHSGLSFSTGGFSCGWDSGTIGFMMVDVERWDVQHGGEWSVEAATQRIVDEVQDLDNYHVYGACGYVIETCEGCECCGHIEWVEEDSCWGFYGDPEERKAALIDHVGEKYRYLLEGM